MDDEVLLERSKSRASNSTNPTSGNPGFNGKKPGSDLERRKTPGFSGFKSNKPLYKAKNSLDKAKNSLNKAKNSLNEAKKFTK